MIRLYLTSTVYRIRPTRDQWGEVSTTASTLLMARVEWGTRVVIGRAGEEVVSQAMVLLAPETVIQPEDLLRIDGVDYPVKTWRREADFSNRVMRVFI